MNFKYQNIYFCDSYGTSDCIIELVLSAVEQGQTVLIVVYENESIHEYFQYVAEEKRPLVHVLNLKKWSIFKYTQTKILLYNIILYLILEYLYINYIYRKYFKKNVGSKVHFFTLKYKLLYFAIILRLSKRNEVFFKNYDATFRAEPITKKTIKSKLYKWVYGMPVFFVGYNGTLVPQVSSNFKKNIGAQDLQLDNKKLRFEKFRAQSSMMQAGYSKFKIILLDHDLPSSLIPNMHYFDQKMLEFNNILNKNFSKNQIGLKRHPVHKHDNRFTSSNCHLISTPTNANFFDNKDKIIISYYSHALKSIDCLMSISLLKFLPLNKDLINGFEEYLRLESHNKIYFPKCEDELTKLLKNVVS